MTTYTVSRQFAWQGPLSERAVQVCRMFGLTIDRLAQRAAHHRCTVDIAPGDIVYIMGPSGAGKSVLLRELQRCVPAPDGIALSGVELPDDRTVIDCFEDDLIASLRTLNMVGLGDVFSTLNRPSRLSDGQKYRFRLARALVSGRPFVFADEFCSELDRITAATVAFNIHRFVKGAASRGPRPAQTTLVLASSRDDILIDLAPDVLIDKDFTGEARVIYRDRR
ncbi:MAG: ATP-binding cassette domain-containing protein [Phycisphaerales bacterium]